MMKSSFATFLLLGVIALLVVSMDISETRVLVRHGNINKEPLEIVLEKYICTESRVPIVELFNSAQAILPNGDTYFFNDVGNVLLWLGRQKNRDEIVVWVYAQDTERYVLAQSAWYSRVEITPMGYGFGAYEYRVYGQSDYYFNEVQLFALRGETLLNPMINSLLANNKI
ncbi:hypothetical protein [Sulfurospirillum oryzae]|uniref:hypothetical protein n=1 Tax=Sulfurospirillum oryzae TaxID=2976535 RepID=UPI0021E86943|nr:hypothetical protein [Sulfurospirillum oryzae]